MFVYPIRPESTVCLTLTCSVRRTCALVGSRSLPADDRRPSIRCTDDHSVACKLLAAQRETARGALSLRRMEKKAAHLLRSS